jgi:hypothetical protein
MTFDKNGQLHKEEPETENIKIKLLKNNEECVETKLCLNKENTSKGIDIRQLIVVVKEYIIKATNVALLVHKFNIITLIYSIVLNNGSSNQKIRYFG